MEKTAIKKYFDGVAAQWDSEMIRSDTVISKILDNAGVKSGHNVLDIACGTGVLVEDYLRRGVASVTGIDISDEMLKVAREKFKAPNVSFICADAEELSTDMKFDNAVLYNAFPHFPNPERLIESVAALLKSEGTFSIAHGMSREKINEHHRHSSADSVSNGLIPARELAKMMEKHFDIINIIDNEEYYQVTGKRLERFIP